MEFLEEILQFDADLFIYLNSFHNDFWDWVMVLITRKETWLPFYLTIIYFIIKKFRSKSLLIIIFLTLVIVFCDQLANFVKDFAARERPIYDENIKDIVHQVIRKGGRYGYFSAHAANTFGVFVFTSRLFKNRGYTLLLLIWTLIISYSRIYIGVHFPLDVITGMIVGALIGYFFYRIVLYIDNHFFLTKNPKIYATYLQRNESEIIWVIFLVLVATIFIGVHVLQKF